MLSVALLSGLLNALYLIAGVGIGLPLAWGISLFLDRRLALSKGYFSEHFRTMQASPVALGAYLGLRWLGICVFVGLIIAAFLHG